MKMKIGLTGGTGFIGQYLIRDYCDIYDFIVASSKTDFSKYQSGAKYVTSDYSITSFIDIFSGCDAVVHLGSYVAGTTEQLLSPVPLTKNIKLASDLFEACSRLKLQKVINISSVAVYSQQQYRLAAEYDSCHPTSTYGIAKLAIEELANLYVKYKNLCIITLRLSQVLGYRENVKGHFYSMLLKNAQEGNQITVWGSGKAARDIVYVKDVIQSIDKAIKIKDNIKSCIYNIGMGKPTSNLELAEAYCLAFNNSAGIIHIPVEIEDTSYWGIDITKAREELGYSPQYDIFDMVNDIKKEWDASREKRIE